MAAINPAVASNRDLVRPPVVAIAAGCVLLGVAWTWWANHRPLGVDSAVYRAGAMAVLHSEPLYEPLRAAPPWGDMPFISPPVAAILFVPLTVLPTQVAWGLLAVASVLALGVVVRTVLRHVRPAWAQSPAVVNGLVLLAFAPQPVWSTIGFGQVNLILMALVVVDVLAMHGSRYCGVLIGIAAAVKLTPLIFILQFAAVGRRADAVRALGTFAALQAAAVIAFPSDSLRFWTSDVLTWHRGPASFAVNQSLNGMVQRVTGQASYALLVSVALAIPVVALAVHLARRLDADRQPVAALLATALCALVVSPVSWLHHWVWVVPLCLLLLHHAASASRRAVRAKLGLAGVVVVFSGAPFLMVPLEQHREPTWGVTESLMGNSYLLGALVIGAGALWSLRTVVRVHRTPEEGR